MRGSLNVILMLFLFWVVCVSPFCLLMLHFQYLGDTNYLILRSPMLCHLVYAKVFHTPLQYQKILRINCPKNLDISPYDDRLAPVKDGLDILGADHEVYTKDMSIGTAEFGRELKTLTLIMFSIFIH